ncbi:MAG: hypothetical protein DRN15_05550 [Thermoprotei archaeon]|nr:MAG: hypothetical protein DRM97_06780 [Thermoprotei archaeon]RLF23644.1 MAG: hypothetical protein DRN15_05550 [Thermoprotei archaeon]
MRGYIQSWSLQEVSVLVNYVITVDVGTTTTKAILFDEEGNVVRTSTCENNISRPETNAAEHYPEELWRNVVKCVKSATRGVGSKVTGLCLSTYMHGLMAMDNRGKVVLNVMTHLDLRAAGMEKLLRDKEREIYERTGCPPIFVYPLIKMLWLRHRRRDLLNRIRYYMFLKDYLIMRLIGKPYVDYGIASGTQLFNINDLKWDDLALEIAEVEEEQLAVPVEGAKELDTIRDHVAKEMGLEKGVILVPGTFDGAAQSIGLAAFETRLALNLGSTAVLRALTKEPILDQDPRMRIFAYYAADGHWAVGGALNNGGSLLRWLRDTIARVEEAVSKMTGESAYDYMMKMASKVPPGSDGLLFFPFLAGERFPFRDPHARGTIIGLKYSHSRHHIFRAALEGIGYLLRVIKEALEENGIKVEEIACGGGGARSKLWLRIISDILKAPLIKCSIDEEASNLGLFCILLRVLDGSRSLKAIARGLCRDLHRIAPCKESSAIYEHYYRIFVKIYEDLRSAFTFMAKQQL